MANNFVDIQSQAIIIATMIDKMTVRPLRPRYIFDGVAKQKEWNLNTNPTKGDKVEFPVLAAFSANTAALDPTTAAITGSKKPSYTRSNVSLELYGDHSTIDIMEFRPETFADAITDIAWSLMDQGMNSLNKLARDVLDGNAYTLPASRGTFSTTYHGYASGDGTAGQMGPIKAIDVRRVISEFKAANVMPFSDGYYVGIVTPAQSTQLRSETGNAAWTAPAISGDASAQRVWNGDIGTFEGCRFIVNTENYALTNTAFAYFVGDDSLGKAIGTDLTVKLNSTLHGNHENLLGIHWHALVGYKVIRRDGVRIISSSTSNK
jgi:N4-gp56 family major capsid protein